MAFKPSTEIKKEANKETKAKVMETYGRLPLCFIKNDGQIDEKVKFYEKSSGYGTYFTEEGIYLSLVKGDKKEKRKESKETIQGSSIETEHIKLCPLNIEKGVEIIGESRQEGKVNYFIGNDPEKWRTEVPTYKAVVYRGIYKGIDIKFYGNHRQLEYDIVVKPGAEPSVVRFDYEGAEGIRVTEAGELEISLKHGKIIQRKPHIYQEVDGEKKSIKGGYVVDSSGENEDKGKVFISFRIDKFDTKKPLIIDPVLFYSTYLGGSSVDQGQGIAVDSSGSVYITGRTISTNFPTVNPIQGSHAGGNNNDDVFVTKLNPAGSELVYSTYLGGSGNDHGNGIAVDSSGSAYITGWTNSTDFPITNPIQGTTAGNNETFVTKLGITETISTPNIPTGPTNGASGINYIYFTGGSISSLGHDVQYIFDWGDGTTSGWLPVGVTSASKFWTSSGSFLVKTQARCSIDISVVSEWSPVITVNITTPIALQSPLNNEHFNACSLFSLPLFSWTLGESFDDLEIQFSSDQSFNSISVKVKGLGTATQTTMTKNTWKKVLSTPGVAGGTVYWRVIGTRSDKTTATSEIRSIVIDPAQQVGRPTISPTTKSSLPTLSWQNNCNIKFKAWFGKDNTFTKRSSFVFNITNPTNNGGVFSKQLTSGQWMSIRRVVGNVSGSTIYWYVESWDGMKRYAKTEVMSFLLTD